MSTNILYKILAAKVETPKPNGITTKDPLKFISEDLAISLGWNVICFEDDDPSALAEIFKAGQRDFLLNETVFRANQATVALAALNTLLFGQYGEARGLDKKYVDRIKEYLDGIATNAYNEMFYHLTNYFPPNQAYIIFQGEGKAEKAGSSASSPTLSWGRVYAHPDTARKIERLFDEYFLDKNSTVKARRKGAFNKLISAIEAEGINITGIVIDTLENTGRAAKGEKTGPMAVVHMINGPCITEEDFEGYAMTLTLTSDVARRIPGLSFDTPVEDIVRAITITHPDITPDKIDVYTLYDNKTRTIRLQERWDAWKKAGVHIVEDNDVVGHMGVGEKIDLKAFRGSGTYAPNYLVGIYYVNGQKRYFINDGYAATAEALQGLSAAAATGRTGIIQQTLPEFKLPIAMERDITSLDPRNENFEAQLRNIVSRKTGNEMADKAVQEQIKDWRLFVEKVCKGIAMLRKSGYLPGQVLTPKDILHHKHHQLQSIVFDAMLMLDPYTGIQGIEQLDRVTYRVRVRTAVGGKQFVTTFIIRPQEEQIDFSRALAKPLGERLLGYSSEWKDYRYSFAPSHVGQLKRYLVNTQYMAVRVVGQTYYVSKAELRKLYRFPATGDVWAQVLAYIKEIGGSHMDWLRIVEDFDGIDSADPKKPLYQDVTGGEI